jgi:hypothetical protein
LRTLSATRRRTFYISWWICILIESKWPANRLSIWSFFLL